jgi:hypothetical protein
VIGEEPIAAKAVEYLPPYLGEAAKSAAGKLGGAAVDGAVKLLGYLKGKLSGDEEKAALADKLPPPSTKQTMTLTGDDNTGVQASGSNITVITGGRGSRGHVPIERARIQAS